MLSWTTAELGVYTPLSTRGSCPVPMRLFSFGCSVNRSSRRSSGSWTTWGGWRRKALIPCITATIVRGPSNCKHHTLSVVTGAVWNVMVMWQQLKYLWLDPPARPVLKKMTKEMFVICSGYYGEYYISIADIKVLQMCMNSTTIQFPKLPYTKFAWPVYQSQTNILNLTYSPPTVLHQPQSAVHICPLVPVTLYLCAAICVCVCCTGG